MKNFKYYFESFNVFVDELFVGRTVRVDTIESTRYEVNKQLTFMAKEPGIKIISHSVCPIESTSFDGFREKYLLTIVYKM